MMATAATRIVLADDHGIVREGIANLLRRIPGVQLVGQARNGRELIECIEPLQPHIVLTDVSMPEMGGIEACAIIRQRFPHVRVLVLSMHDSATTIMRAFASGACGYLLKDSSPREFEDAVLSVRATGSYRSERIAAILAAHAAGGKPLTARQIEVLRRIALGENSKEIAYHLGLSPKTVDVHRVHIMDRLDIRDIASLTRYALRTGLVSSADRVRRKPKP